MSMSPTSREVSHASPETSSRSNEEANSYNESRYNTNQGLSARFSASTIAIDSSLVSDIGQDNPSIQQWRLSRNWNWKGGLTRPADVVIFDPSTSTLPITEYPLPSSAKQSSIVGFSHATVSRVVCQRKVLARKTEALPRSNSSYHLEEMRILKQLNHQHIIQLCGAYVLGKQYHCLLYPVAELDLVRFMHLGRKDDSANWVRTLTRGLGCLSNALAYLHAKGIRHRDIKPANILVLGDVMIFADFGSARKENDTRSESYVSPGRDAKSYSKNGMTWHYMAPECVDSLGHGKSADIFSLGLVIGEILDYIFWSSYPQSRVSSVERRLEEYNLDKQDSAQYEPLPMTKDEEDFSNILSNAEGFISEKDARLLCSIMTAKVPLKRPSADQVLKFFRARHFDLLLGSPSGDGYPPTCGKCCE
ncbi:kinase-like domain-containing protein [Rhexocercosporidium sp. MPI-PUGE-AT-0058]|nr:kinase-like domain-containing protein [Rhexocercosporidium sp. MPI-PUGE-AT-0058]